MESGYREGKLEDKGNLIEEEMCRQDSADQR